MINIGDHVSTIGMLFFARLRSKLVIALGHESGFAVLVMGRITVYSLSAISVPSMYIYIIGLVSCDNILETHGEFRIGTTFLWSIYLWRSPLVLSTGALFIYRMDGAIETFHALHRVGATITPYNKSLQKDFFYIKPFEFHRHFKLHISKFYP